MKILHLYKDYAPVIGGIENHIRLLAEAQARRGHEVTVLVTSRTRHTEQGRWGGVEVIKAARLAEVARTPLSLRLPMILRELEADVAHAHFPYPMGEVAALLALRASKLVFTYHSDVVRQAGLLRFYRPLMQRILDRADALIATSPPYAESSEILRAYRDKVQVVPLAIELARYTRADRARVASLRQEWSPDGEPLLLFVGKLRYYKGLDVLLQAMALLPKGRLLIVGSGPERARLDALGERLGLDERVHFLGELPDAETIALRHAARDSGGLFVLPASHRSEAFGMVLLEAMAAGLPLVTTELGTGTSWVNQDGVTGRVVPPNDPAALAEAISALLAAPARRAAMGVAARHRVEAFDVEPMADAIEAVYRSVGAGEEEVAEG